MSPSDWLLDLLKGAQEKRWCMLPYCTTCGCQKLRSAVFETAQQNLGFEKPFLLRLGRSGHYAEDRAIGEEELRLTLAIGQEVISELRNINVAALQIVEAAVTIILIDLDNDIRWQREILDEALKGCAVGDFLTSMREHDAARRAAIIKKEETEQQNRKIREERRKAHEYARLHVPAPMPQNERIEKGTDPVHQFLKKYVKLPEQDQLKTVASSEFNFPLEVIPKNLIPVNVAVETLDPEDRKRLHNLIGRRGGRWRRLKTRIG